MTETAVVTEESLARDLAERFQHNPLEATKETVESEFTAPDTGNIFDFDENFQTKIAACALKDAQFNHRTEGLIRPEYFQNIYEATLVNIALRYYQKYKRCPDVTTLVQLIKQDVQNRIIQKDMVSGVRETLKILLQVDIGDVDFVVDSVAEFAQHQAMELALVESAELLLKRDFKKIGKLMQKALDVGAAEKLQEYDYFAKIEERTQRRREEQAFGDRRPNSITTGVKTLDKRLYRKGWGRKELSVLMGAPKSGKSTGLAFFAKNAALAGYNVLYVTLEVSTEITTDRLDACLSAIPMMDLPGSMHEAHRKIESLAQKSTTGKFYIEEFPSGALTPSQLRRVIQRYKSQGIVFDLLVVDYLDIMAPDRWTDNDIANSKQVWVDVRAIAQTENLAILSATQTNREGAKAKVATMTHAAEDFNKIRIADLVVSINATDEEKAVNEARLFFAASRNQRGNFCLRIKQDLEAMNFLKDVLREE
jgi:replicative DNA helicase